MEPKEAIAECAANPTLLRELPPALFEQVVAELLASYGWEVSVTPMTRDGGYDILGVTTDKSGLQTSWVVECKRYSSAHKIGVELVRQLVGVKYHIGVPNAVLVTTSSFTAGALEVSAARQDLQLVDMEKLESWLNVYTPPAESTYTTTSNFSSCFISHSSKDEEFAERLSGKLRQAGVRIWYAPEDIAPGDKIYKQVKKAISTFDRLLIVLSTHSMESNWVRTELASAISREQREKSRILFPVSLVPIAEIRDWECHDSDSGIDIARELRTYHIPEFSNWRNQESFNKQVAKVVGALREPSSTNIDDSPVFRWQQQLRSGSLHERAAAAKELGKLGAQAQEAVPTLRLALKSPSMYLRDAAAWALAEIKTPEAQAALQGYES